MNDSKTKTEQPYSEMLKIALKYAERGIKVFPCTATKKPILKGGFKIATCDGRTIISWWRRHPNALIGAPNEQFVVIDDDGAKAENEMAAAANRDAMNELHERKILSDRCLIVDTPSGGTHYYFRRPSITNYQIGDKRSRRAIKVLPEVDLLSDGGYVILPDQINYKARGTDEPWARIKRSPKFPDTEFSEIRAKYKTLTDAIQQIKSLHNKLDKGHVKGVARNETNAPVYNENVETASDKKATEHAKSHNTAGNVAHVDYENDAIVFKEMGNIYKKNPDYEKVDPTEKLMGVGGKEKIKIGVGELDTKLINKLFHNQQIQLKLLAFLGLKRTWPSQTTLNRSILPKHKDNRPSLGVRWHRERTHVLCHDFSNFANSLDDNHDYNLVRLYICKMYNTIVYRVKPAEFSIWFLRMLYEADIIDIDDAFKKFGRDIDELNKSERKAAMSMLLLDALKSLHKNYDGSTTFADKFSSAWAKVSVSTIGKVKKSLLNKGFITNTGVYNCASTQGRHDNFFCTPLYKIETDVVMLGFEREHRDTIALREQRKGNNQVSTNKPEQQKPTDGKIEDYENDMEQQFPNVGTLFRIDVSQETFNKINNFCIDFEIPNVVDLENMFSPIFYSSEFIGDVIKDSDKKIYGEDLEFFMDDSPTDQGNRPLLLRCNSEAFDAIFNEISVKHGEHNDSEFEEPSLHFVVSYDIEDLDLDLELLSIRVNEYFNGVLSFQGISTDHLTHEQLNHKLDGVYKEDGDVAK